jgi:integrase/recombinase XerD
MNTPTLAQRLDAYLAHIEAIGQSPVHRRQVRFSVLRTIQWLEQIHQIQRAEQLTSVHLDGWFRHLSTRRTRKGLPLKATSVSKQFQCDRAFLLWLEKQGVIPTGISEALPSIKIPHLLPTSVLNHSQAVQVLKSVRPDTPSAYRLRTMLEVLYSSGMRAAELIGLNLDSVDLSHLLVRVWGKGSKERMAPLGVTAGRFVEGYLKGIRPLLQREPGEIALFLDDNGRRIPYHTLRRMIVSAKVGSGIQINTTAHTFRRSCATEMIRNGANLWLVAAMFGIENVETLHHYVKLNASDLKKSHAKHHPREKDRGR